MSTDPHGYRGLNEHHAEIENQAGPHRPGQQQAKEQDTAASSPQRQDQKERSNAFAEYMDYRRGIYGENAHLTPEREADLRRAFGKDLPPPYLRQEISDIEKTHDNFEQDRQFRLQQEADQSRMAGQQEGRAGSSESRTGYQSLIAENERGNGRSEREQDARHAEFVSRLAEKSGAQRQREQDGNER